MSVNLHRVFLSHYYNHLPQQVFDAWIKPAIMRKWLFESVFNRVIAVETDPHPGGNFFIRESTGDKVIEYHGKYLEIDRPNRLTFTLEIPKYFSGAINVNIIIDPKQNGSELKLIQTGISLKKIESIWNEMLYRLNTVLNDITQR
jgi:uncharacterized protein YndB with AHSA1/START domain